MSSYQGQHSYKGKKKRRNKNSKKVLTRVVVFSICALLIVLSVYFIKTGIKLGNGGDVVNPTKAPVEPKDKTPTKAPTKEPTKEPDLELSFEGKGTHLGEFVEEIVKGPHFSYGLRYPKYEDATLSEAVKKEIDEIFEEQAALLTGQPGNQCRLWIDYEDGICKELVSATFLITREVNREKETEERLWVWNNKKKEEVDPKALFGRNAYRYLAELVNEAEGLSLESSIQPAFLGSQEEFQSFKMEEEGIRFFYVLRPSGEKKSISVPFYQLHTYMTVTVNGTVRADNIRELDPSKPMIAFTFDDGPHYLNTPRLVEILKANNARATFFVLGDRLTWEGSREAVAAAAAAGNEIGSHTWSHNNLTRLSTEDLDAEFEKTRNLIYEYTGEYPTYVRAPGGNLNDTVKAHAFAPLINWSIDSRDWETRDAEKIVPEVCKYVRKNRIILMHDIYTSTIESAEILIPKLIEEGYQIVTLSELFFYNEVDVKNGVLYTNGDQ